MDEIPNDLILDVLSPLLGGYWIALLFFFSSELHHVKYDIQYTSTSPNQKSLMILSNLQTCTDPVSVIKLKTFIEKELERLK